MTKTTTTIHGHPDKDILLIREEDAFGGGKEHTYIVTYCPEYRAQPYELIKVTHGSLRCPAFDGMPMTGLNGIPERMEECMTYEKAVECLEEISGFDGALVGIVHVFKKQVSRRAGGFFTGNTNTKEVSVQ